MRKISLCRRLAFCAVTLLTNLLVVVTTSLADLAEAESDTAPFVRAFGALADGSWAGLFSGSNEIDPIKYATDSPEKTIFKSAQYALSSTVSGDEIWYGTAASVWCYWPYISMKMPLGLMNFETPHQGCQLTPPAGQRPQAQIYIANVDSGETIHVGPATIADGEGALIFETLAMAVRVKCAYGCGRIALVKIGARDSCPAIGKAAF